MQNFQDTFETRKQSFISAFSISKAVPFMSRDITKQANQASKIM